jgi:hypothetical protein
MLVFWCYHSAASSAVKREYKRAIQLNKRVIPIILDSTDLPAQLSKFQWIDLRQMLPNHNSLVEDEVEPPGLAHRKMLESPDSHSLRLAAEHLAISIQEFLRTYA